MKILFVYKGRYHIRDTVIIEYLSAIAKKYGHDTSLAYDLDLFGVTDNVFSNPLLNRIFSNDSRTLKDISRSGAHLVVFLNGFIRRQWNARIASTIASKPGCVTVLFSYAQDDSFRGVFDYRIFGEPEAAFEWFIKEKKFEASRGEYRYKELADLNELPLPDKTLFSPYVNFKDSYMLYTSKGCPYECSYCEETVYKGSQGQQYFRRMSPARVLQELTEAKKTFHMREVIFKDSVFALDKAWLKEFLAAFKKDIRVPFKCFGKAEVFDEEMAVMLKESGCYCVEFGAQNFNEQLKRHVLRRVETNQTLLRAFAVCDSMGLRYDIDHLFGIPGESVQDHVQAASIYSGLKLLNRIKCHNLAFYREAEIFASAPVKIRNNPRYNADFFSSISGETKMVEINKNFQKYFRFLPLLSKKINSLVNRDSNWKIFKFIPTFLITFFMLLLAVKNKDKRFFVYAKLFSLRLIRAI